MRLLGKHDLSKVIDWTKVKIHINVITIKGNTDTSGLVSGPVPIMSGGCGAKFKPAYFNVCIRGR